MTNGATNITVSWELGDPINQEIAKTEIHLKKVQLITKLC